MAEDRYMRDRGERSRSGSIFGSNDRARDDDDRGFFERAGDQIRDWMGGDDDQRRGSYRDDDRFRRETGGGYGSGARYGATGGASDRQYGGGAGSYGRRDHAQSWGEANQSMDDSWTTTGDTRRSGSGRRDHFDDHYRSWRDQQIQQFDRDYEEYRREQQQQFHSAFDDWRKARQSRQSGGTTATGSTGTGMSGSAGTGATTSGSATGTTGSAERETESTGGKRSR